MPPKDLLIPGTGEDIEVAQTLFPICVERLSFETRDKAIIKSISVDFADVACTAVLGHNGAGKSVLMRMLHGLVKPTGGSIRWGAAKHKANNRIRASQAMVFQKPVLLRRSVAANLRFVLKRQSFKGSALEAALTEYLALADLAEAANRPASVLSGGEAQRLAIVRALATNPLVLFLDEPTASLDPRAKASVEKLLRQIMNSGVRLVLVTQDIGQAERLASEIVVLHEGRVVETGPVDDVLHRPQSKEANAFLHHEI
ncbi:MAG: ATP-binding cassette domain-containing protein [Gammaproteobacteria bacterium]